MPGVTLAPLSCAKCSGRIDPGDELVVVAGANYHPDHAPDVAISGPFVQRPTASAIADAAAWDRGGDAA